MESDFKEHPKTVAPDDFWGQIKRTVNGKPVSQEQIDLIVETIRRALTLQPGDQLLDLACGNGALSRYFFSSCESFLGVDFSEYLIKIAKENFERSSCEFHLADVGRYVLEEERPERFTKVLCYGSYPYFPEEMARLVLKTLRDRFVRVEKIFIGNLPDIDRASDFFTDGRDHSAELKDSGSKIGIWRSEEEFIALAEECGWDAQLQRMPGDFYAAHYRYDALLSRRVASL